MIGRLFEQRVVQDPGWAAWARGDDVVSTGETGGQIVTPTTSMQLLAVYGCVTLIADSISTMPVHTVGGTGVNPMWLERPNAEQDRVDFFGATIASLLTEGNAFIAVFRDRSNRPAELQLLDPARVHLQMNDGNVVALVDGRVFPSEMMTIRGLMMPGAIRGMSPINYARQIVGLGLGAQDQATRFFAQGSVVPGVIQTSGNLTKDQMREIRDQWVASHGGSRRSHLPVVLAGDAKWQGITMTQEQAQFLETRRYTDAQIAGQLFKVDPSMLGIPVEGSSQTYANIEHRGIHLVRHTLLPWIVRLERAFSRLLPSGQEMKINVAGLLRADLESRYRSYEIAARIQTMTNEALLTVDEMREFEDLN
jgi:HK97 family phage portal protein